MMFNVSPAFTKSPLYSLVLVEAFLTCNLLHLFVPPPLTHSNIRAV